MKLLRLHRAVVRLGAAACLAMGAAVTAGCLQLNTPSNTPRSSVNVGEPRYSQSPPPVDARPTEVIRAESAQLRARLAELENNYKAWTAAIDTRKATIQDLKRQRDDLKKDRDRWKKAAKHGD